MSAGELNLMKIYPNYSFVFLNMNEAIWKVFVFMCFLKLSMKLKVNENFKTSRVNHLTHLTIHSFSSSRQRVGLQWTLQDS